MPFHAPSWMMAIRRVSVRPSVFGTISLTFQRACLPESEHSLNETHTRRVHDARVCGHPPPGVYQLAFSAPFAISLPPACSCLRVAGGGRRRNLRCVCLAQGWNSDEGNQRGDSHEAKSVWRIPYRHMGSRHHRCYGGGEHVSTMSYSFGRAHSQFHPSFFAPSYLLSRRRSVVLRCYDNQLVTVSTLYSVLL